MDNHLPIIILTLTFGVSVAFVGIKFGAGEIQPQVATAILPEGCSGYDEADAGPAWMKGYFDSQKDFKVLNGHGYDDSTHFKGVDKENYVAGYKTGWRDAEKGVTGPFC